MSIYEPREDSYLLEKVVKDHAIGNVLDMGTGSGILAFAAAEIAKKVTAVDIALEAVSSVQGKIKRLGLTNITAVQSDLFRSIPRGERFDTIICNPPYLPTDTRVLDLALDGGKQGYEFILRFLAAAKQRLTSAGQILLLFSSTSKKRVIDRAILAHSYHFEALAEEKLDFETLYAYRLTVHEFLARGKRGVVYLEQWRGKTICVKQTNPLAEIDCMAVEAHYLKKVNRQGIGPQLYFFKDDRIGMEYIKGKPILEFFEQATRKQAIAVVKDVLRQCFILDRLGVTKEEMTNPYKHVIVRKMNGRVEPVLIDFERARHSEHAQNVTQFLQFLKSVAMEAVFKEKRIAINRIDHQDDSVKQYAAKPSVCAYLKILAKLGLASFNERCYALLCEVPAGKVTTYNDLAHTLGTRACRAVGQAMHTNPYAPEVPCHRVVAARGGIGGFASGTAKKIAMLKKEGITVKQGVVQGFSDVQYVFTVSASFEGPCHAWEISSGRSKDI